jgi:hypothetical protein
VAEVARFEEQLRHKDDAKCVAELGKVRVRLAVAGGVAGVNAAAR